MRPSFSEDIFVLFPIQDGDGLQSSYLSSRHSVIRAVHFRINGRSVSDGGLSRLCTNISLIAYGAPIDVSRNDEIDGILSFDADNLHNS